MRSNNACRLRIDCRNSAKSASQRTALQRHRCHRLGLTRLKHERGSGAVRADLSLALVCPRAPACPRADEGQAQIRSVPWSARLGVLGSVDHRQTPDVLRLMCCLSGASNLPGPSVVCANPSPGKLRFPSHLEFRGLGAADHRSPEVAILLPPCIQRAWRGRSSKSGGPFQRASPKDSPA